MRIDSIEIFRAAMPLLSPFRTAFADTYSAERILVRMKSDGSVGWGEASPWNSPNYSSEWAEGAYILARDWLAPCILNHDIESGDELQERLSQFKGNSFAKAAFDLAWWDIQAKRLAKPLWRLLGGSSPVVEVGEDFGVMDTIDSLLHAIQEAVECGFKRVKLKVRPGWDLDMVRAVRQAFPKATFHVDCNSAYRLKDLKIFETLDQYGLAMIEQPLAHDDLIDHAKLQRQIQTPVCLDESIVSAEKALKAIEIGAGRWFNIKPGRVGGITPALKILRIAESAGIPCWIGGMLESAVGASHCLALATLSNIKYPSDIFASGRFFKKDLAHPELELSGPSQITASEEPGIGCLPNEEMLAAQTIESCKVGDACQVGRA